MDPVVVVLIVAGVALLLALLCMVAFLKSRSARSELEEAPSATRRVAEAAPDTGAEESTRPKAAAQPEPDEQEPMHRFKVASGKDIKQCLFVILEWPGLDTNRRLARLLKEYNAQYDAKLGVYKIRDPLAGYKLTIANSSPPGTLPPIHEGDDQPTVPGVSVLIHFVSKRSVARNPETLIQITQSIASLGGHILDAERNAVSNEEFEQLRQHAQNREAATRRA
ncbi:cell division protein ZipA C-terminal FtsZ-binding domain-containing protein [Billgrantia sp. Q4P2]|uniref:cell division protein ZipA C-terminal FtsZ-binding domain-containing protein n=1 Tax=Billgrantia sp. Q4P2 TaxID=3463857 RepID=UPI004056EF2B